VARAGLAALAVLSAALAVPAAARPSLWHVPCQTVAASPSFATDHVLFCASATNGGTGVEFYRSSDAGHTWTGPTVVERGQSGDGAEAIFPSPAYRTDHTLYLGTFDGGGYVSTDSGTSFGSPLTGASYFLNEIATVFLDGTPGGALARPDLIVGAGKTQIYDPSLPPRPVTPSPLAFSHRYIIPPDYPSTHQAVELSAQMGLGPPQVEATEGHARAYGCVGEFACNTLLYDFAPLPGYNATGIGWSGPTYYPSSPDNYAVIGSGTIGTVNLNPPVQVYRSPDYGRTWAVWPSVTRLFAPFAGGEEIYINASPDAPHRLFLHLTGGANSPSVPDEQLYRSDDNGANWHRIGCAWGPTERARYRCTLPFNATPIYGGVTLVEPGGRLYLVGEHDTGKHTDFMGLYCSRDYGVHWTTAC
jgi:hypothetical protein